MAFSDDTKLDILRAIDKLDRIGALGVKQLLTTGRHDESGAFTPGLGLSDEQASLVLYAVSETRGATNAETLERLRRFFYVLALPPDELMALKERLAANG